MILITTDWLVLEADKTYLDAFGSIKMVDVISVTLEEKWPDFAINDEFQRSKDQICGIYGFQTEDPIIVFVMRRNVKQINLFDGILTDIRSFFCSMALYSMSPVAVLEWKNSMTVHTFVAPKLSAMVKDYSGLERKITHLLWMVGFSQSSKN